MAEKNERQARSRRPARRRKRSLGAAIAIRFFQAVGTLLLIAVVTGALLCCYAAVYIKSTVVPKATLDLSAYALNENSVIYYYDKETDEPVVLQTLVGSENRQWVDYDDIPQELLDAVVSIEDKRFYQHHGVDWYRTAGAFVNMFVGMKNTFGASTLTQQLVKNLTEYDDITVNRKILEIFTALDVEKTYEKKDILTYYLNEIFLGNGCYGVGAAAQFYFGKDVSDLTLAECASLAGITNNPSLYSPNAVLDVTRYKCQECGTYSLTNDEPCDFCGAEHYGPAEIWNGREYNKARQELILRTMADPEISPNGAYITQAEYEAAVAETLVFRWDKGQEVEELVEETSAASSAAVNSWYVDAVISEVIDDLMEATGLTKEVVTKMVYSGGLKIYVPYDPDVQAAVDAVYNDRSNLDYTSRTGQQMSSAITVVDNSNGWVVAMAGDVGEKTINRGWNNALAARQPGSSIKPLSVYSPALDMGLITPASVSDDNPRLLNDSTWPLNVSPDWRGLTTIQDAVVRSVNTIAVNVLEMVTPRMSYEYMTERYGITTLVEEMEVNGQIKSDVADLGSLSMGGLTKGLSTFEMAAAYATFPREGGFTEATTYLRVENVDGELLLDNTPTTEYVINASTAYYINSMLTSAVNNGTGYYARIPGQTVAGKTGTTNNKYDLWFAGYTAYYTAVVWTGYPNNETIGLSGNPSVTLWQKVMSLVHQDLPNQPFSEPDDVREYSICVDCGKLATSDCANDIRGDRTKVFRLIKSDAPTEFCVCHVPITICTESPILDENGKETGAYYLAAEFCPEECRREVTMVDYDRVLVKEDVVVTDYYAHLSVYEGLEDPYCPLHREEPGPEPGGDPEQGGEPGGGPDDPDPSDDPGPSDDPLPSGEPSPSPEPSADIPVTPTVPPETPEE